MNTYTEKVTKVTNTNKKIHSEEEYKIREIGKWSEAEVSSFINSYKTIGHLLDEDIETIRSRGGLSPQERTSLTQIMYNEYKKQNNGEADNEVHSRIHTRFSRYIEKPLSDKEKPLSDKEKQEKSEKQKRRKEAQQRMKAKKLAYKQLGTQE